MQKQINASYYERVASLESEFQMMKGDIKKISHQLDEVRSSLDQIRGGWRGLLSIVGVASFLGAMITGLSSFLK